MPPRFVPAPSPRCPRCTKAVYSAEQVIGPNGAPWHKTCYTCRECNRRLDSSTLAEHEGEAYCKTCHKKCWGPTGYGYASGLLVREDPESQFKQGIGRPVNSEGSVSSVPLVSNNTGGSNSGHLPDISRDSPLSTAEEDKRREQLIPVNATLKKRNSLDMIREQAEASRRAYDEAHAQRMATKHGRVQANSTGGSTASSAVSGSHPHADPYGSQSGYLSAGSDTSSAFGSTMATTSSPVPSFTSISSSASSQAPPSTKSLYLNQSLRPTHNYQDAESDYAKSRQALAFQTGAPSPSAAPAVPAFQPALPSRSHEPAQTKRAVAQQEDEADKESYLEYVPFKLVARKDEPVQTQEQTKSWVAREAVPAVHNDEWEDDEKQAVTPRQSLYEQQSQQHHEQQRAFSASTSSSSARLNSLINEADKLSLQHQEDRQQEQEKSSAPVSAVDEWDEEPTPTMPSKPKSVSYQPARHVSSAATRTWSPSAATSSPPASSSSIADRSASSPQTPDHGSTHHSRVSSADHAPLSSPSSGVPKQSSYFRAGSVMSPKKMPLSFGGGGDICPRCQKTVYAAESALAPGGSKYHKLCLRCVDCSKSLDSTNMTDRQGVPYCKTCYGKAFGQKGYGYGSGSSFLHTEM